VRVSESSRATKIRHQNRSGSSGRGEMRRTFPDQRHDRTSFDTHSANVEMGQLTCIITADTVSMNS